MRYRFVKYGFNSCRYCTGNQLYCSTITHSCFESEPLLYSVVSSVGVCGVCHTLWHHWRAWLQRRQPKQFTKPKYSQYMQLCSQPKQTLNLQPQWAMQQCFLPGVTVRLSKFNWSFYCLLSYNYISWMKCRLVVFKISDPGPCFVYIQRFF